MRNHSLDRRGHLRLAELRPRRRGPGCLRGRLVAVSLVLVLAAPLSAPAQSYLVHTYGVDEGLPSAEVFSIAQDDLGRIWLATRGGLAIYDGLTWEVLPGTLVLPGAPSVKLRPDGHGRMWSSATNIQGLITAYSTTSWSETPRVDVFGWTPSPGEELPDRVQISAFAVYHSDDAIAVALGLKNNGVLLQKDGGWIHLDADDGLPPGEVRGITSAEGRFHVITDRGLCSVADGVVDPHLGELLPPDIDQLLAVATTRGARNPDSTTDLPDLWLLDRSRLYRLVNGAFEVVVDGFRMEIDEPFAAVLLPTDGDNVYFSQKHRIFHYDLASKSLDSLDHTNGLVADGATDMIIDREDNLWVASQRGVSKVVSQRFANYTHVHGLLQDEVTAVCERPDGEIVLGHNNGLSLFDGDGFLPIPFVLSDNLRVMPPRVMDLITDHRGQVWLAASQLGLGLLRPSNQLQWFPPPASSGDGAVFAVVEVEESRFLVGCGSGLYFFDGRGFDRLPWNSPEMGGVRRVYQRRDGTLYATTSRAGLVRVDGRKITVIDRSSVDGASNAYTILEDSSNRLWVGTRAGLFQLQGERLVEPRITDLQITNPVFQIVEDADGNLWIGTDNGVIRWSEGGKRRFSMHDGLAGRETNRAAGFLDSRGALWLGTESGVSVYQPEHDWSETARPSAAVVGVEVEGGAQLAVGDLELDHSFNTLVFHIAGISMHDEQALRFRCRLDGFDQGWSDLLPSHQRSVRYTNLPPGRYQLALQAVCADGEWSDEVLSGEILINTALWQRWWAILLAMAAAALLFTTGVRLVLRWRYANELEQEMERRRSAEEQTRTILHELEESRVSFASIVEENADGILVVDYTGRVQFANRAACLLLNQCRDDLLGSAFMVPQSENGMTEIPVSLDDGGDGIAELRVARSEWQGTPANLVVMRDVSSQRNTEAQLRQAQRIEAVGKLAGGVAHDFNNLLQAILSSAEALRIGGDDAERRERLISELQSHVHQGSALTRHLLMFSRSEAISREVLDLNLTIQDNLSLLRRLVRENIGFAVEQTADNLFVDADRGQLAQVLTNLVVNACDAMPDGGRLTIRSGRESADRVWLEVEDTGIGIPTELRDRIFEPFFTTKDADRGTGLGLSVVHGIVTQHGGRIEALSRVDQGSRFRISLPAAESVQTPPSVEVPEEVQERLPGHGERILLVEDDEAIRRGLAQVLTNIGYHVSDAESAEQAEEVSTEEVFDLLLTDLVLPGRRGDDLARSMRTKWPDLAVVIMSGYTEDEATQLALQVEAASFLYKPFEINRLSQVLRESLEPESSAARAVVREAPPEIDAGIRAPVLVVEDNMVLQRLTCHYLANAGYLVEATKSGQQALEIINDPAIEIALVVTDMKMPEVDGLELFHRGRETDPELPFIFCSGDPAALLDPSLKGAARVAFLCKPFDVRLLAEQIEKLLRSQG